jgi:hypothetical protein
MHPFLIGVCVVASLLFLADLPFPCSTTCHN